MSTPALPADLSQHAAQLLAGTGLTPSEALQVADGTLTSRTDLTALTTALRDGWRAAAGGPCLPTSGSSAIEWFDLGQRFYAHSTSQVASRLSRAPIAHVPNPIAVRARQSRDTITVEIATPDAPATTAINADALALLHTAGVRITATTWRALIAEDSATLPALLALARRASRDGKQADTAAHIAWWLDRTDFPGTGASIHLPHACAERWVTGSAPERERHPATWRHWLGLARDDAAAMLTLLTQTASGPCLPGLTPIGEDDAWSWNYAQKDHSSGIDWRSTDTIGRAAAGLRARCDIADLYAAALLTDPLYRRRSVHSGHVVTGTVVIDRPDARRMTIACDRLDARLRVGDAVIGWIGEPDASSTLRWNGTITATNVVGSALMLTLTVVAAQRPADGSEVTVLPAPPNAAMLRSGRRNYRRLYGARRSWLSTGRTPAISRRDVPLDILFAPAN